MCRVNSIIIAFLSVLLFCFSSFEVTYSAREGKQWRKQSIAGGFRRLMAEGGSSDVVADATTTFNVLDYGAKGDGRTDDSKVRGLPPHLIYKKT